MDVLAAKTVQFAKASLLELLASIFGVRPKSPQAKPGWRTSEWQKRGCGQARNLGQIVPQSTFPPEQAEKSYLDSKKIPTWPAGSPGAFVALLNLRTHNRD